MENYVVRYSTMEKVIQVSLLLGAPKKYVLLLGASVDTRVQFNKIFT